MQSVLMSICGRLNGDLLAELRELIVRFDDASGKKGNGDFGGGPESGGKDEQTAREGGDLRADHVFMQRVSGIVISS